MWADETLKDEVARTEAITKRGIAYLREKGGGDGFFLWLHYVNPHAPYTPPAPFDVAFTDRPKTDRRLKIVDGFFGGVSKQWAESMGGKTRLSDYVNAYDGEIAYSDTVLDEVSARARSLGAARPGHRHHFLRSWREPGRTRLLLRSRRESLRSRAARALHRARARGHRGAFGRPRHHPRHHAHTARRGAGVFPYRSRRPQRVALRRGAQGVDA
jgi:hypothetical protein